MLKTAFGRRLAKIVYSAIFRKMPVSYGLFGGMARKGRYFCAKLILADIGKNVNIEKGAVFADDLVIGNNSGLGVNARVSPRVTIGDNVIIGDEFRVITRNHVFGRTDIPIIAQGCHEREPVVINDDVWVGTRVTILPGVTIGKGAILGAGSVVTKDVAPYTIVGGNPARVIRSRK